MDNPLIIIPARLASTRLPNKPLALIDGVAMIVRVYRLACQTAMRVVIASGDEAINDVIAAEGGEAILTDPSLPSGSDRICAALEQIDPQGAHDCIINLQGDLPIFDPMIISALIDHLPKADITTPIVPITSAEANDPHFVKAVLADDTPPSANDSAPSANDRAPSARVIYFSRQPVPYAAQAGASYFGHIGIYAYHRAALARFAAAPPAPIEARESLEQLRALAMGMHIEAVHVQTMPLSVDTPEDLAAAEAYIKAHRNKDDG